MTKWVVNNVEFRIFSYLPAEEIKKVTLTMLECSTHSNRYLLYYAAAGAHNSEAEHRLISLFPPQADQTLRPKSPALAKQ